MPGEGIMKHFESAEAGIAGVQAGAGHSVLIYVKGMEGDFPGSGQDMAAAIDALPCDVSGGAIRTSDDIHFRTVFLIDNSLSIKSTNRERMKELTQQIIQSHADGEEFILYTFSRGLQLAAAGTDYEALSSAAGQIRFHDQDAYLVDCLADVLEQLGQSGDCTYNRIILMSDGVDDNKGGKTYVDLMAMLKEDRYRCPIYTVTSVWEKDTSGLKNLQALSREVSSDTFILDETQDLSRITAAISDDYEAQWFRIHVPLTKWDGTVRTIQLSARTTQEQYDFTCQVKMPEPTREDLEELERMMSEGLTEKISEMMPGTPDREPGPGFASRYRSGIITGTILLMITFTAVMILILRKRRSSGGSRHRDRRLSGSDSSGKTVTDQALLKGAGPFPGKAGTLGYELTRDEYDDPAAGGQTVGMWDTSAATGPGKKILLTDIRDTRRKYEVILKDEITVGRDTLCTVVIRGDRTVSGTHCRLFLKKEDVMVEDLHSYNGTSANGKAVLQPEVLHDGDELKLGAARLKVSIR